MANHSLRLNQHLLRLTLRQGARVIEDSRRLRVVRALSLVPSQVLDWPRVEA